MSIRPRLAQSEPVEAEKLATLEAAWSDLEAALGAIPSEAPTPASMDAARAAAGDVRAASTAAFGELNCTAMTPAS